MISIVVPAHNESSVIARTLGQWFTGPASEGISVVVVCNGCSDDTAKVAQRFGPAVRVVESEIASKTHALNLGDRASAAFPRIYVDADIVVSMEAIRALAGRLEQGGVLAVAPTAEFDLRGCSWLVREYYRIRSRLPSSRGELAAPASMLSQKQDAIALASFRTLSLMTILFVFSSDLKSGKRSPQSPRSSLRVVCNN
jgi:glycosyltransferase involved in cell wall biosynthesis